MNSPLKIEDAQFSETVIFPIRSAIFTAWLKCAKGGQVDRPSIPVKQIKFCLIVGPLTVIKSTGCLNISSFNINYSVVKFIFNEITTSSRQINLPFINLAYLHNSLRRKGIWHAANIVCATTLCLVLTIISTEDEWTWGFSFVRKKSLISVQDRTCSYRRKRQIHRPLHHQGWHSIQKGHFDVQGNRHTLEASQPKRTPIVWTRMESAFTCAANSWNSLFWRNFS